MSKGNDDSLLEKGKITGKMSAFFVTKINVLYKTEVSFGSRHLPHNNIYISIIRYIMFDI